MNQDNVFLKSEGDSWFLRNKDKLAKKHDDFANDSIISILKQYSIKPRKILEIGCSNGWRLDLLQKTYHAECAGVDPSDLAIQDGKKRYPKLILHRALASKLPMKDSFDLVIISFVFHWIAREELLKSVAEVDRMVQDDGFLLISDFAPDVATRVPYHHLPNENVYTYKANYSEIFTSSTLYTEIAYFTFNHDSDNLGAKSDSSSRGFCSLIRKSLEGFTAR
jgi:ubiquinone/menaquinone biosynthesis C-methylase UbiE